jgi:hypothetical protein
MKRVVQIFYVESGAAFYEHCGRNFEYYKCISQPNNGTFSQNIFSVHILLCCTVLVFTASGKGAQAIGSFTPSSVLYFNSFKSDRHFPIAILNMCI